MARIGKLILIAVVALIVCIGLGFAWGASGRMRLESSLDQARQQIDIAEARGALLDARISLYNNNFGDASRHLEDAKGALRKARDGYQQRRKNDAAGAISSALERVDEAQRLAGKLDPAANSKASEALDAVTVATQK
jgi:hypothetical protein